MKNNKKGFKNTSYKNKQRKQYSEKKKNLQKKEIGEKKRHLRKQRRDISMFLKQGYRQRKNTKK